MNARFCQRSLGEHPQTRLQQPRSFEHCRNQKAFGTPGCEWADPNDPSKQISIMYQLLKASPYNVSKLSSYVDSINADGSTFFNAGLDLGCICFKYKKRGLVFEP